MSDQIKLAQLAQFAKEIKRLVCLLQHLTLRLERYRVASHGVDIVRREVQVDANRSKIKSFKIGGGWRIVVFGRIRACPILFDNLFKRRAAFNAITWVDSFARPRHRDEIGQDVASRQKHVNFFWSRR